MNYRCCQVILRVQHLCINQERCEVLTGYLSLGAALTVIGRIRDIGLNVLKSSFQTGSSSGTIYFHVFFLIAFLEEAFIRNIIIRQLFNYNMNNNNNNNNAVFGNNFGRSQDLILLFKIPMGTRNNFLEMYRKFGHAPGKGFASPALDCIVYSLLSTSRPHQVNSQSFCNCISVLNQSLH